MEKEPRGIDTVGPGGKLKRAVQERKPGGVVVRND